MKNNLFRTGQKFTVVEPSEDSTYPVGSTGFMSFVERHDQSYMNLAQVRTVMVRRGKTGKERIEHPRMYFPIFPIDAEPFKKAMPDKGMRKGYVFVQPEEPNLADIMTLDDVDFLGWSISYVRMLRNAVENCKHHQWPGSKNHLFNKLMRANEYFDDDPEAIKATLASVDSRNEFLAEVRPFTTSLVRVMINKAVARAEMLLTAAEFLDFTNSGEFIPKDAKDKKNEFHFTDDDKELKTNIKIQKKKLEHFKKLSAKKSNKS